MRFFQGDKKGILGGSLSRLVKTAGELVVI